MNLLDLFGKLGEHRVWYIRERHVSEFEVENGDNYVASIVLGKPDIAELLK